MMCMCVFRFILARRMRSLIWRVTMRSRRHPSHRNRNMNQPQHRVRDQPHRRDKEQPRHHQDNPPQRRMMKLAVKYTTNHIIAAAPSVPSWFVLIAAIAHMNHNVEMKVSNDNVNLRVF